MRHVFVARQVEGVAVGSMGDSNQANELWPASLVVAGGVDLEDTRAWQSA